MLDHKRRSVFFSSLIILLSPVVRVLVSESPAAVAVSKAESTALWLVLGLYTTLHYTILHCTILHYTTLPVLNLNMLIVLYM